MSILSSFVGEVETAIAAGDEFARLTSLRRMTDLFANQAAVLSEEHVTIFDEVILRLARNLEFRARIELSERLAGFGNAPKATIRALATDDDIAVARPVLERSARLSETELIEIAQQKSQAHLLSLSRRSSLTERVTDILVERGDDTVVRSVASNSEARFSSEGFDQLVTRARSDTELQELLQVRADLPEAAMATLVEIAREHVRRTLKAEIGEEADPVIDAAVHVAASAPANLLGAICRGSEVAPRHRPEPIADDLDEEKITRWIRDGNIDRALAAIGSLANIPDAMLVRAYEAPDYDPLLFIVRSLNFGWITFKLLLTHKAGRQPPYDVMRSAFDSFQQLSPSTAQRVVRFTAERDFPPAQSAA